MKIYQNVDWTWKLGWLLSCLFSANIKLEPSNVSFNSLLPIASVLRLFWWWNICHSFSVCGQITQICWETVTISHFKRPLQDPRHWTKLAREMLFFLQQNMSTEYFSRQNLSSITSVAQKNISSYTSHIWWLWRHKTHFACAQMCTKVFCSLQLVTWPGNVVQKLHWYF